MGSAIQIFVVLLVSGLLLFGAEIFVPGGILGSVAALCLLGAVITGFAAFPGYGAYVAVAIVFLLGVAFILWIRLFPGSRIGQSMTVSRDMKDAKASADGLPDLLGKTGTAHSDLRPGGFATIEGRRVDVVTQGGMIERGAPIEVIDVEGNRVVVSLLKTKE